MFVYDNPVIPGFNPDPSVCRAGDDFYLVTSSFEFFPGVPVYHSRNLVNWELIGHCLIRQEQLPLENCQSSRGIYAPTIRYNDGIFYMTTTNTNLKADGKRYGNFIVHTKDINGQWSDPVWVGQAGIDPSLLFDNGKVYFCSNAGMPDDEEKGVYLCEINPLTGKILTWPRLISKGCGGKCTEAPHIYRINGWYYLLLAEGGTSYGHMAVIQRSRGVYGPYENCPHNPILSNIKLHRFPIQAIGHADLVDDKNGAWWAVCLGIRLLNTQQRHNLGRETFLSPVRWEDDWPLCGEDGTVRSQMKGPLPAKPEKPCFDITENFTSKKLSPHWNFIRNPDMPRYSLENGCLNLYGGAEGLSDKNPVFTGVRQQSFFINSSAKLRTGIAANARAGITAFLNDSYHFDLAIEKRAGVLFVIVNRRVHDFEAVSFEAPVTDSGEIELRITADMDWYCFGYRRGEEDWQSAGKAMTAGLSAEGTHGGCFTGVYIGLYSSGGKASFTGFSLLNLPEGGKNEQ